MFEKQACFFFNISVEIFLRCVVQTATKTALSLPRILAMCSSKDWRGYKRFGLYFWLWHQQVVDSPLGRQSACCLSVASH